MKMIKNIIEYLIAISVIPAIVLTVISVTELKDVRNVQYELLSEEEGIYNITPGTYEKLVANKRIKNYELESNYPLITQEEMDRATWEIEDIKNEIYIDENGEKRIRVNIGRLIVEPNDVVSSAKPDDVNTHRFYIPRSRLENKLNNFYFDISSMESPEDYNWYMYADGFPHLYIQDVDMKGIEYRKGYGIWIRIEQDIIDSYEGEDRLQKFRNYLQENPLIIYYELAIKNPNNKVIESNDLYITSDHVRIAKPNDFSNNPEGLLISNVTNYVDRFEVTTNWINIYPKDITVTELRNQLIGKTLTYELAQPRPVEVYDFSKFRLVFNKNRIRVIFDIDDGYYLWEITKDDKMIPINGQYDLGNIWTVKFYVYEIQQPLIRTLVLLIPLIVISGVLFYMFNIIKKRGISY